MREYNLKFSKLSNYAPILVADLRARMHKLISWIFNLVVKECRTMILIREINISRLMTYVEKVEREKLKERRMRDSKRVRFDRGFLQL